ncbi:hydantoinase/oxoprolinase family protein [Desulfocurvus sp. DL9XJH121]
MLLGIDVGGTHTDAVVLDRGKVLAEAKVATDHDDLLTSIRAALGAVLEGVDPGDIRTVNLSTTLSTNAIVESKTEEVGLLVSAGPGIDPENYRVGGRFHVLSGSVDHRGTVIASLDPNEIEQAMEECRAAGIRAFAAVTKFSPRNPDQENALAAALDGRADFTTLGHTLSGVLNFPRRIATAYFNSAVWRTYNDFALAVRESLDKFGLDADINVLKADGGTMPLSASAQFPVQSILSGPAASVMGMIALCDIREDCVTLDIGGTTTDISVFAGGSPVVEEEGMTVGSYPTLVKALKIRSIGVGGDSRIRARADGTVTVGPDRQGPALANCGPKEAEGRRPCSAALTDALNYLGLSDFGDVEASRAGIEKLAELWDMAPERLARKAVARAVGTIREAARDMVDEINAKPVYTIREILKGKRIRPARCYVMGGPAKAMALQLEQALEMPVDLPGHHAVANAIGAALTRPTVDLELFADTEKGRMFIPGLDVARDIPRSYTLDQAQKDALAAMVDYLAGAGAQGVEPEITEAESFNMVDYSGTSGRNIRVKCQVRPGIVTQAKD